MPDLWKSLYQDLDLNSAAQAHVSSVYYSISCGILYVHYL